MAAGGGSGAAAPFRRDGRNPAPLISVPGQALCAGSLGTRNPTDAVPANRNRNSADFPHVLTGMQLFHRRPAFLVAALATLLTLSACAAAPAEDEGTNGNPSAHPTASASAAKKKPGGVGGLLSGGLWKIQGIVVDKKELPAARISRPWVEFHGDGTASGNYGCTPFRVKADMRATALTVGDSIDTSDTASPSRPASPSPSASGSPDKPVPCDPQDASAEQELTKFEKQLKNLFTGPLTISRAPDPWKDGRTMLDLKNRRGDSITVVQLRSEGFFRTRWKLDALTYYDSRHNPFPDDAEVYYDFHANGAVSGKLGCNDFTGRADFSGPQVTFHDAFLTTHRTCSPENVEGETHLIREMNRSLTYSYAVLDGGDSLSLSEDIDSNLASGLEFRDPAKR
ncbi:META domain-containing protein [Streptomyces piniterrae]|uniref:META domain-containing protein n=1 Tax=Streptomyces piniterrae TaxID=2571125 RepID=A0A4U0NJN1_9ACTN|nr:META domain-containing protein [Streptomyces piniterrae]TJZ54410.1 META domain-containing protein [Streptomyces piniterrae]